MAKFDKKLGAILSHWQLLTEEQRDHLLAETEQKNSSLTEAILENRICTEMDIVAAVSQELSYHPIDLDKIKPSPAALETMTEDQCAKYLVLPVAKLGRLLTVAAANPFDVLELDNVHLVTNCDILPVVTTDVALKKAIKAAYGIQIDAGHAMTELMANQADGQVELTEEKSDENVDITELQSETSPIVKMVNLLVLQAIEARASDIHIEPFDKTLRIRYRVDGACQETVSPPKKFHSAITSRVKIMCGLDIAEHRKPQDGKFQMKVKGRQVDFRVSILPMVHGEKTCIRILDSSGLTLSLASLGFEPQALEDFQWAVKQPYGMVLVTGPTGSGKSTTLYSAIREVMCIEDNITTVEDPVEYQLDGVNQVPVSDKRGLTFAAALRSILRQDPDTVLVGEIRDMETAEIAIKAALTGHLVLSTLHTNDAPSTITRLVDMKIDPFMVSSSVNLVSAQRLLRKLCLECREKVEVPRERMLKAGVKEDELAAANIFAPKGCGKCKAGYKGRFAILETMRMAEDIRRVVIEGGSALDIRSKALEHNMVTLRRCALLNCMRGKTSFEEVLTMTLDEI